MTMTMTMLSTVLLLAAPETSERHALDAPIAEPSSEPHVAEPASYGVLGEDAPPAPAPPLSTRITTRRVLTELGLGLLTYLGALAVIGVPTTLLGGALGRDFSGPILGALIGGSVSAAFGTPIGVALAGNARGGDGSPVLAGLGALLVGGAGVGTGVAILAASSSFPQLPPDALPTLSLAVVIASTIIGPLVGAILGYELSTSRTRSRSERPAHDRS